MSHVELFESFMIDERRSLLIVPDRLPALDDIFLKTHAQEFLERAVALACDESPLKECAIRWLEKIASGRRDGTNHAPAVETERCWRFLFDRGWLQENLLFDRHQFDLDRLVEELPAMVENYFSRQRPSDAVRPRDVVQFVRDQMGPISRKKCATSPSEVFFERSHLFTVYNLEYVNEGRVSYSTMRCVGVFYLHDCRCRLAGYFDGQSTFRAVLSSETSERVLGEFSCECDGRYRLFMKRCHGRSGTTIHSVFALCYGERYSVPIVVVAAAGGLSLLDPTQIAHLSSSRSFAFHNNLLIASDAAATRELDHVCMFRAVTSASSSHTTLLRVPVEDVRVDDLEWDRYGYDDRTAMVAAQLDVMFETDMHVQLTDTRLYVYMCVHSSAERLYEFSFSSSSSFHLEKILSRLIVQPGETEVFIGAFSSGDRFARLQVSRQKNESVFGKARLSFYDGIADYKTTFDDDDDDDDDDVEHVDFDAVGAFPISDDEDRMRPQRVSLTRDFSRLASVSLSGGAISTWDVSGGSARLMTVFRMPLPVSSAQFSDTSVNMEVSTTTEAVSSLLFVIARHINSNHVLNIEALPPLMDPDAKQVQFAYHTFEGTSSENLDFW